MVFIQADPPFCVEVLHTEPSLCIHAKYWDDKGNFGKLNKVWELVVKLPDYTPVHGIERCHAVICDCSLED